MKTIWFLPIGLLFVMTTYGFSQVRDNSNNYFFKDTTQTPLSFIAKQFYKNVQGLDSCCIMAFGSAKFTIQSTGRIDSVWISVGIPKSIASALEDAIYATATYWKIDRRRENFSIIIPLFIAPSNLCPSDSIKDNILASSVDIFTYHGNSHTRVRQQDYYKQAKGVEAGIILPPLLIKGRLNDKFIDIFEGK